MKTILLISPYWQEKHRWMVSSVKLANLWQRLGYKVVVLCMGEKTETKKISDTLEIHSVKDFFLPDPWNYGIAFGFSIRALKLAREVKPDIIVVNKVLFWSSFALVWLRLAGHRVILTTDALVGITWWPRGQLPKIGAAIYANTLGWLILRAATKVVFFHPQPEKVLQRLGIQNKSQVIPTGIDPTEFAAPKSESSVPRITYIGRLESVKGVDDFLGATMKVKKEGVDIKVRVVGWFKEGHPLVEEYKNEVEFTGLRADVAAILRETDIFVLPSYSEGLSNALMEAMASGCACIASDVGGNAYLIQNGICGFLFPAGDREALASHIRRLVQDPPKRKAMGEKAKQRIDDLFNWEKVGQQYRKLFDSFTLRQ